MCLFQHMKKRLVWQWEWPITKRHTKDSCNMPKVCVYTHTHTHTHTILPCPLSWTTHEPVVFVVLQLSWINASLFFACICACNVMYHTIIVMCQNIVCRCAMRTKPENLNKLCKSRFLVSGYFLWVLIWPVEIICACGASLLLTSVGMTTALICLICSFRFVCLRVCVCLRSFRTSGRTDRAVLKVSTALLNSPLRL